MKKEVLHKAIDYLSRREHSEKELVEKLKLKTYQEDDIAEVIVYLKAENYQSDGRYAESFFRNRVSKGFGWLYIVNGLKQHNIDTEIIKNLNKSVEIDWYLQAELAYNKRFGMNDILDLKDKAKRMRFLQYRGFTTEQIMALIKSNF